jgi:hypothetical protein
MAPSNRISGVKAGYLSPHELSSIVRDSVRLARKLQRTRWSDSANKRLRHGVNVDLFAAHHDDRC